MLLSEQESITGSITRLSEVTWGLLLSFCFATLTYQWQWHSWELVKKLRLSGLHFRLNK